MASSGIYMGINYETMGRFYVIYGRLPQSIVVSMTGEKGEQLHFCACLWSIQRAALCMQAVTSKSCNNGGG